MSFRDKSILKILQKLIDYAMNIATTLKEPETSIECMKVSQGHG